MVAVAATHQLPLELEPLVERIVETLRQEAAHFTEMGKMPRIESAALQFTRVIDPASQLSGYEGVWRNRCNDRCGTLTINSDGSFYAEYDLFCPHPRDGRWFVEMVTAWGVGNTLRCEAKLIPAL